MEMCSPMAKGFRQNVWSKGSLTWTQNWKWRAYINDESSSKWILMLSEHLQFNVHEYFSKYDLKSEIIEEAFAEQVV